MTVGVSIWTPELVDRLLELVGQLLKTPEMRLADIADELGVGRNALIGKIERLRRKGVDIPSMSDRMPRNRNRPRSRIKPETLTIVPPLDEYVPLQAPAADPREPPPEPGRFTLLDLEDNRCHWPLGDRPPFLFCGAAGCSVSLGSPYCRDHTRIAYNQRP